MVFYLYFFFFFCFAFAASDLTLLQRRPHRFYTHLERENSTAGVWSQPPFTCSLTGKSRWVVAPQGVDPLIGSLLSYFSWSRGEKKSRSDVGPIYHGSDRSSAAQHDRVGDQQGCVQSHHTWSERTQEETPWLWVYIHWYTVCCCHPVSCRASEKQTYRSCGLTHSFTRTWQSGSPPGRAGVWRLIWSEQTDHCQEDTHEKYLPWWCLCRFLSVHLAIFYRILPLKSIQFLATNTVRNRPDFSLINTYFVWLEPSIEKNWFCSPQTWL